MKRNKSAQGQSRSTPRPGHAEPTPHHLLRGNIAAAAREQPELGRGGSGNTGKAKSAAGLPGPHSHCWVQPEPSRQEAAEGRGEAGRRLTAGCKRDRRAPSTGLGLPAGIWIRTLTRKPTTRQLYLPEPPRAAAQAPGPPPLRCRWEGGWWISKCFQLGFGGNAFSSGLSPWSQSGEVLVRLGRGGVPCLAHGILSWLQQRCSVPKA